jgi:molybdopterin-guanine dinucleotide biosynthesis protein A
LSSKLSLTAAILAGGRSTRMGSPKCLIILNNEKVIEILLKKLNNLFQELFIITNFPELYFHYGYPLIGDIYPFKGPMAGIQVAMKSSKYDIFAFACDMPFIEEKLIFELAEKHLLNKTDITVCSFQQKLYPLPGIYSKNLLSQIENLLSEDKLSLAKLIHNVKFQIMEVANINKRGLSFININTQEDLEKLKNGGIKCLD